MMTDTAPVPALPQPGDPPESLAGLEAVVDSFVVMSRLEAALERIETVAHGWPG